MSKQANPAAVGGFVLGAIALAVGGVLFFGGGKFFADTERYVVFFEGSVNGLQLGSPVKFEGVEIGEVVSIKAIVDLTGKEWILLTETIIEINRRLFERRGAIPETDPKRRLALLIEHGFRARLGLQSLITGQLYVAIEVLPDTEPRLLAYDAPYPELPAVPTKSQEIQRAMQKVMAKLEEMKLEDIMDKVKSAIDGADRLVNDPNLEQAIANLNETLEEAHGAVADARHLIENVDGQVKPVGTSATAALRKAQQTLASVDEVIGPGSATAYQISVALQELTEAAQAIRLLATYLEENPNSLVFGRESGGN